MELFRMLMLALSLTLAGPNMSCDKPAGTETYCWVVDGSHTTILNANNVQRYWPKLMYRYGLKPISAYRR